MIHEPLLEIRKGWGITVRLRMADRYMDVIEREPADPDTEIDWAVENAQARRISYDTWQFRSRKDAEQFIMLFILRWS
jgi:hypothetical protein